MHGDPTPWRCSYVLSFYTANPHSQPPYLHVPAPMKFLATKNGSASTVTVKLSVSVYYVGENVKCMNIFEAPLMLICASTVGKKISSSLYRSYFINISVLYLLTFYQKSK